MGMSAAHCRGNVREFQSVWRLVTLSMIRQLMLSVVHLQHLNFCIFISYFRIYILLFPYIICA